MFYAENAKLTLFDHVEDFLTAQNIKISGKEPCLFKCTVSLSTQGSAVAEQMQEGLSSQPGCFPGPCMDPGGTVIPAAGPACSMVRWHCTSAEQHVPALLALRTCLSSPRPLWQEMVLSHMRGTQGTVPSQPLGVERINRMRETVREYQLHSCSEETVPLKSSLL